MSARPPADPFAVLQSALQARAAARHPGGQAAAQEQGRPAGSASWRGWLGNRATSVRRTLVLALAGLVLVTASTALVTRDQLSYRVHDYAILNLAGQLREMASALALDASQLQKADPGSLNAREIDAYQERLSRQAAQFKRIIDSFETRNLPTDLTGLDQPVICNWDAPSLQQLRATAVVWRDLYETISPALSPTASPETVMSAARLVSQQGQGVLDASRQLSGAFKDMMQLKLNSVIALQWALAGGALMAAALAMVWLQRRVLRPLAAVEACAVKLIDGDMGARLTPAGDREIAAIADAMNRLSSRLRLLFDVAERTNAGLTTAELLDTLRDALHPLVAVDLMGVVVRSTDDDAAWRVLRTAGVPCQRLGDGSSLEGGPLMDNLTGAVAAAAANEGFGAVLLVPLQDSGEGASALFFATRNPEHLPEPTRAVLRAMAAPVRAQLERTLSTEALVVAAVEGLAKLAESRDPETGDHLVRMSAYSAMLGAELAQDPRIGTTITPRYVESLRRFAPMHDIGKVGIADSILLKPGRLTDDERTEMQRHPLIGADVLRRCEAQMQARGRTMFEVGIEIAESHHEKWDGTGYPNGLRGEAIPLSARIVAVADVFDALTSKRPYKEAWPVERALAAIDADAGRHFDPAVVAALHRRLPQILAFHERHKHV